MRVENITFSISQSDMDFVVGLLSQKEKLEKACESNPDRKGEFMWEIEKLCYRIGNVLILKNRGLTINREAIVNEEPATKKETK
ncbi:hypothetical protein [Parasutterella excrementihominis]|uniref:hypothetical protein n=1 Tax=Parasutterella excrementihominis TaxID=487175 RepID=UPI003AB7E6BF